MVGVVFLFFLVGMAVAVGFGFWGGAITDQRTGSSTPGFLLGFFFGPIGIVICYVMPESNRYESTYRDHSRECPYCKESIRRDASVCPFCRRESRPW